MSDENFYLVCETCGEFVRDPIDHAFETGHRHFKYVGITRKDTEEEE